MIHANDIAPDGRNKSFGTFILLASLVAVAAALRITLANYSLWFDEFASLYFATRPMSLLWGRWMVIETNPPLFYTFLKGWMALGAQSPVALRMLPILGGIAQVALLCAISHRWFGTRAAIITAIIAAVAPQNIFYSHLLRGYIFAADGVLISLYGMLLVAVGTKPAHRVGWLLHVGGSLLAIYCHTTMFLWPVISAIGFCCLNGRALFADRGRMFWYLALSSSAIAAGSAWWLYISSLQIGHGIPNLSWNKPVGPREFLRQIMDAAMLGWDQYDRDKLLTNLVALLTLAGSIATWKCRAARFITLLFVLSLFLFCLAGMKAPIIVNRVVYWMSLFPTLIIAAWLGNLRYAAIRWGVVAALSVLLLNNLRSQHARFEQQDWSEALHTTASHPGSVLLVAGWQMIGVLQQACWVDFGTTTCPFRTIVLPLEPYSGNSDRRSQRLLVAADLERRINSTTSIYVMHSYAFNPLGLLMSNPDDADARFFIGPLSRSEITQLARQAE